MKIYVASPCGFSAFSRGAEYRDLISRLSAFGYVWDPWAHQIAGIKGAAIGERNMKAIRFCEVMVALLDGAQVDDGTAAEIGCASAFENTIIGLRTDPRAASDEVGGTVNLQVEYFIRRTRGGEIVKTVDEVISALERIRATENPGV